MNWFEYFDALNVWKQSGVFLAVLVVGAIFINIVIYFILKALKHINAKRGSIWFVRIVNALGLPLQVYTWGLLSCVFAYVVADFVFGFDEHQVWFNPLVSLISLACFIWFLFRLIDDAENFYLRNLPATGNLSQQRSAIKALSHLGQLGAILLAVLILLGILQVPLAGLLTFGGISSIAMAYAAKGMFTNYFAGIGIYIGREFSVGDWIRSPDRDIEGIVEYMGWRSTHIRRFDKQLMFIPNEVFGTLLIINVSRMTHCRIRWSVGIGYQHIDKLPAIIKGIQDLLNSHERLDAREVRRVYLDEFAESSLNLIIDAFTETANYTDYLKIKEDIMLKAAKIIEENSADIAFPTRVIYTKAIPVESPEAK